jgi:hypothetical protein
MKNAFFAIIVLPAFALAQGSSVGSSFLKLPANSRVAATGEAFVADSGGLSTSLLNPASLAPSKESEVLLSHAQWIQDVQVEFIGASVPLSFGVMGVAVSNTNVNGIEVREIPGPPLATFTARFVVFQLLYAARITEGVYVGANAKYFYEKIYVDETSGWGCDVGAILETPLNGLRVGIAMNNLGSIKQYKSKAADMPTQLKAGGVFSFTESNLEINTGMAYARDIAEKANRFNFGAEIWYDNSFVFRGGYQSGFESRGLSVGAGFQYQFVRFDYALLPFSLGLGTVHMVSVGFRL